MISKKFLPILLVTLALSLASCTEDAKTAETSDTYESNTAAQTEPETTTAEETEMTVETETEKETEMETEAAIESEADTREYNTTPFCNPLSTFDAPDSFMTYDPDTGYYYALFTQVNRIELFRSKHVADIFTAGESKVIVRADGTNSIWGDIWAPEMHRGPDGLWYIYSSARFTPGEGTKRIFVYGSLTSDPFGEWEFKRRPFPTVFSIDPTVYTAPDGTQYMCSSKVDPQYGQVLVIGKMVSPYKCEIGKVIAKAELEWELVEPYTGTMAILEGGFFLENNGRLFLIYSANGWMTKHYALGVLEFVGDDMCDPDSWIKHPEPLLVYGNGVYGPGHASFFRSPDGTEVWCAFHGMKEPNESHVWVPRFFNIQKVEFDETGYPVMGQPVGYDTPMAPPSGEEK
jgi:GH43 family beta-xylosidase